MSKKRIFIFDLDGTLCNNSHRSWLVENGNKRWDDFFDLCLQDTKLEKNCKIFNTVNYLKTHVESKTMDYNIEIWIWTARPKKCFLDTKIWMKENLNFDLTEENSKFRQDNDRRPDYIVKEEFINSISESDIKSICMIYDDKESVINMYKLRNLPTTKV